METHLAIVVVVLDPLSRQELSTSSGAGKICDGDGRSFDSWRSHGGSNGLLQLLHRLELNPTPAPDPKKENTELWKADDDDCNRELAKVGGRRREKLRRLLFLVRSSVTANHAQDPSPLVIWATSKRHDSRAGQGCFWGSQGPPCPSLTRCGGYLAVSCDDVASRPGTTKNQIHIPVVQKKELNGISRVSS
jgi:hypothetical protein